MTDNQEAKIATTESRESLLTKFARSMNVGGMDENQLYKTLTTTAFKPVKVGRDQYVNPTKEQIISLVVVCTQHKLNPFLKEIYAFPAKDGTIVPVVGVDGWSRIINEHPQYDGMDFGQSEDIISLDGAKPCPEWIECKIYRKDRKHPLVAREYLDECYKSSKYAGPWQSHTKRFLRHKAMIQASRLAFGFAGIYDADEAMRINEGVSAKSDALDKQSKVDALNDKYMENKEEQPEENNAQDVEFDEIVEDDLFPDDELNQETEVLDND